MATERVANELLTAVRDWRHWVGNDMLDHLGVPAVDGVRNRNDLFVRRMLLADEEAERVMLEFFERGPYAHNDAIWRESGFKLFISHIAAARDRLLPLRDELSRYGISSFLAHEAIAPAQNWRDVLLSALGSMDALLSFHSVGFQASDWCAQEVGFALGKQSTIVAVMDGELPVGFIAALQAIGWNPDTPNAAAQAVIACLLAHSSSAAALGEALARQLKFAGSWDRAGFCISGLEQCADLTARAHRDIELAVRLNDQVRGNERAEALCRGEARAA